MFKSAADAVNSFIAVIADFAAAFTAVFFSTWLRFDSGFMAVPFGRPDNVYSGSFTMSVVAGFCTYVVGRSFRLYRRPQNGTFHEKIPVLIRFSLAVTLVLLVLLAIFRNFLHYEVSAGVILLFCPIFAAILMAERAVLFRLELRGAARRAHLNSILIVGTDAVAIRLVKCFESDPRFGVSACGILLPPGCRAETEAVGNTRVLGRAEDFSEILGKLGNVTQLIVVESDLPRELVYDMAVECERRMIRFNVVPDIFFVMKSSVEIEPVDNIPLLRLRGSPLDDPWNRLFKRIEDIICSFVGLILFAPVMAIFAILVKCESSGPVFYRQKRCGYGGKSFTIYKIRTMRPNAEAESGPVFASENDDRCTRIGSWMRSHNIDELPQLWNVLRGDMSMVGPRPERPVFVERFTHEISHYMRRHNCLPGITGWAQIHGLRGNTSIEDRLRYDLWYMENWSLILDLEIMLRTVFALRNAY